MKKQKSFPKFKKDLKVFLASEEGKIVEKDAAKLGIALIAVAGFLGGIMNAKDAGAACHSSHGSHGSHGSHSSHGSGGWC